MSYLWQAILEYVIELKLLLLGQNFTDKGRRPSNDSQNRGKQTNNINHHQNNQNTTKMS